jgi:hypothetical protein
MTKPFPLLPTIGTIPPEQIVGRHNDIIKLLRLLRSQSVSVEEMRRMGKTLLLQKLAHLCNNKLLPDEFAKDYFKAKYFSFQGKQNFGEVIESLIKGLQEFKEWHQIDFNKTYGFIRAIFSTPEVEIGGAKFSLNLPEYKKSWKDIFYKMLEDIAEAQSKIDGKLILIFDELPIMLWEWYKEGKHEEALELLDILRERRQMLEKKGIRFIYCGSIGIKIVLATFRNDLKYTGEPTNEMEEFSLKPFAEEEANFLCECFILSGFHLLAREKAKCLELVYHLSNGLPFYISKLFNLIQTEFDYSMTTGNIVLAYDLLINDPKHHKAFGQLVDRLVIYYPKKEQDAMLKVLNVLAKQESMIDETVIFSQVDIDDKEFLTNILYTLLSDHYLDRQISDGKRMYQFKYPIFKAWWKINRA